MEWIKFGWGPSFSSIFTKKDNFNVDLQNLLRSGRPALAVATRTIQDISKIYPPPYTLMVSGGIDSQTMLWLWLHSGVPFNAVSVKYLSPDRTTWFNEHDLAELRLFSEKHNIPIEYKEFNIIDFLENRLTDYAYTYQCNSPQICTHMAMTELVPTSTIIFSGNFASHVHYTYTIWGLKRFADKNNKSVIPFFLLHDPELAGLTDNHYSDKTYKILTTMDTYSSKIKSLEAIGIPVIPQPNKQTGFEKIKEYYDQFTNRVTIQDRIKYNRMPSKRVFDILFRYRVGDKIPYQDKVIYHL